MPMPHHLTPSDIPVSDHWVAHPQGRLFARIWTPPQNNEAALPEAPIVLFHDSLGCVALWRDFPAALSAATGRQVIAYDRLGFGQSGPREARPSLDFIAEEASVYFPLVRAQLGFDAFIAFGHSVGGGMAVHCAAAFPTQCQGLITESAQAFMEDRTREGIERAKAAFRDEAQFQRLHRHHGDKARWVLQAWTENWLHPDFSSWSLAPVLPQVRCPALVLHGQHDEYGSARHPELIAQRCAGPSQLALLAATGHVPHREQPGAIIARVVAWINAQA